jgi:hypothetical protein
MRVLLALLLTTSCFSQVQTLAKAIAKAEGFSKAGSLPSRYRNPGDLKVVRGYRYPGQEGVGKGGHVIFRSSAAGWAALEHQINKITDGTSRYNVNMTLEEIGKKYAGNWRVWSTSVARNLGVTPRTSLWEVLDVPPAMEESWKATQQ